jgi:3,4-dihydroxy 2-butanone 4-phosphate synthase/GTP cyclohydrolase II
MELNTIEEIIEDLRQGKMVILMDDEDRENEGDLVMVAEHTRAEDINFMARFARGLICLTLTEARCRQLDLPLMVSDNGTEYATNFTVSIEAAEGVTTGISAADRAKTVQAAVRKGAVASDIVQPGHVFPLMSQPGGVLNRAGHTEAGCDLARLAGYEPAAVIVEIMKDDGSMARRPDLEAFAKEHDLKIGTIADLIHYRTQNEHTVECIAERKVQTEAGEFQLRTYLDTEIGDRHFAFIKGDVSDGEPSLVRVHVGFTTRDIFTIRAPGEENEPRWDFRSALNRISDEGRGVLVYICQAETAKEIDEKVDWLMSGKPRNTQQNIARKRIGTGSQILQDLGVKKIRLMAEPIRYRALSGFDIDIIEYIANK